MHWIFWNAPFSILECPRISKDIPNFWNALFGTSRLERPVWNAPIFGTPLFSTLKSDWILAGICWNHLERPFSDFGMSLDILERPFFDFGMSRNRLERPFSDFGMSLILFNNFTLTAIETVKFVNSIERQNVTTKCVRASAVAGMGQVPSD